MRITTKAALLSSAALALISIFAFAPIAQAQTTTSAPNTTASAAPEVRAAVPLVNKRAPLTGAPFSSVAERRQTQTLANGTHIDWLETVTRMYRDSQGRTRMEVSMGKPDGSGENGVLSVTISDPVSGKSYFLDPRKREARSTPYFSVGVDMLAPAVSVVTGSSPHTYIAAGSNLHAAEANTTKLGDQSMAEVPVTGSLTTYVYPVGAVGNDQPLTVTRETWESPDLHIMLLTKIDDPRSGENTMRVTQLDRAEPDPSLFQVPADFTIVEK
jgi:hypothetical protein